MDSRIVLTAAIFAFCVQAAAEGGGNGCQVRSYRLTAGPPNAHPADVGCSQSGPENEGDTISGTEFRREIAGLEQSLQGQSLQIYPQLQSAIDRVRDNYLMADQQFRAQGNTGHLPVEAQDMRDYSTIIEAGAPAWDLMYRGRNGGFRRGEFNRMEQDPATRSVWKNWKAVKKRFGIDPLSGKFGSDPAVAQLVAPTITTVMNDIQPAPGTKWPPSGPPAGLFPSTLGDALIQGGTNSLKNGDSAEAAQAASEALQEDPTNPQALRLAAQANALLGNNAEANRAANAYLEQNPHDQGMATLAAITANRGGVGMPSQAAAQAAGMNTGGGAGAGAAGSVDPSAMLGLRKLTADEASARSLTSDARASLGLDPDKAIALASKAIALDGKNADAYYTRGVAYERRGENDLALKDAVAGLGIDPKHAALWALKAAALDRAGRYSDARAAAEAALELNPRSASAWMAEANALAGMGDKNGALKALANAASLDAAYKTAYEQAVNAPADSDLMFLFNSPDKSAAAAAPARKRRFGAIAGVAAVGGALLALGLLPFLMPPLKTAFTKLTRRGSAVHAGRLGEAPAEAAAPLSSGEPGLLRGQYRVLRQIGSGGMGLVYEGEDVSLGRKVAIKRMRDELKSDRRERARFVSEAKLVAALHHPNIVDIYAIVEEGDDVYLVFEHIAGQTLHELIQSKGRLTLEEALPILKGAAEGLEYAHSRGIIHRDLKPSNIMLDDAGRPRVMDFGIARMAKDATRAMTNTIVGTPPYMAPEQEQGLVRKESDVYALALCAYEMLTGRLAFAGTGAGMLMNKVNKAFAPVTTLAPELPPQADLVFAEALDPDPAKRVGSPRELLSRLAAVAQRQA